MLTKDYIVRHLNCSSVFAEMMITQAQGNADRLYDLFLYQCKKRRTTPAVRQIEVSYGNRN
ncbi:hypothetical protein HMPREF9310_01290 [Staphylococcus simulans ACS-120-V-Sch1]|nr:hypothetical protein HMPREF9310_01290 [Staphylococcus simulans ACS-120-V-Sch1]